MPFVPGPRLAGSAGGRERVEGERVEAVAVSLEADGVEVWRGAEADYLTRTGKYASYTPTTEGKPGVLIIGELTEYGDIMHEAKHVEQDRAAGFRAPYSELMRTQWEVEAYQYELDHAAEWGYSNEQVAEAERQRDTYAKLLDELEQRRVNNQERE
jgi:hypothetical protein